MGYPVYVQESEMLNGVLRYSSLTHDLKSSGFIDGFDTLKNPNKVLEFEKFLQQNGLDLEFMNGSARDSHENLLDAVEIPYEVNSPFLKDNHLFPFQNVGLNVVWKQLQASNPRVLVQWDTGAGKTLLSCLTTQKLFDEGRVDKVLVF